MVIGGGYSADANTMSDPLLRWASGDDEDELGDPRAAVAWAYADGPPGHGYEPRGSHRASSTDHIARGMRQGEIRSALASAGWIEEAVTVYCCCGWSRGMPPQRVCLALAMRLDGDVQAAGLALRQYRRRLVVTAAPDRPDAPGWQPDGDLCRYERIIEDYYGRGLAAVSNR
jgi:hypothetical protein